MGSAECGRLGDKILYVWNGRQCVRSMPAQVSNPRTAAQMAHREAFAAVSRLSSRMREAHEAGLRWLAAREHNSTFALFRRLNKDCCGGDGVIAWERVAVSHGSVCPVGVRGVEMKEGALVVRFDDGRYGEWEDDELLVYAFCPDLGAGCLAARATRYSAGCLEVGIPEGWSGHALHLYAFLRDGQGRTSETIYINPNV